MLGDYHLPNLTLPTEEESDKFKFNYSILKNH